MSGFQTQEQVPVTLLVAQPVQATAAIGSFGANHGASYGSSAVSGRAYNGVVEAAVLSTRNVQVVDVPSTAVDSTPAQVVIPPVVSPVQIEFQSQSSPVTLTANHIGGQAAAPQEYSHEEEADIVRQNIVKPVIHEVHETVTPYRRVTQEVAPVKEEIQQLLSTGHREVQQQAVNVQRAAPVQRQVQGATILALVADGNAAGLLSGARSQGASYGLVGGATQGLVGGYRAGVGAQGLVGGYRAGATQGLGTTVQRSSSYSTRSSY